ncbi:pyridoxal phosphate-dependent aminotransferase [Amycolatopsis thermophila]|uniref:Aspartate/methionine/tyrosine aminotransferase n=1 Tax=Amycolatopsis thermophila TaxID=206084 RepID=A0ABU0EXC7_9PSEU|nr:pyridoxal phosphate-dependent aminotransferase [Amycolatopsis thermophila]MDQ0379981.1 aspartate/methionine/tyrosine aminotransferase [Amycolatopsis thermophila]
MRRFPPSAMTGLLDRAPRYDLAESTCGDLTVADLVDAGGLAKFQLGYGTSAGDPELRTLLAARLGVSADEVLVTTGAGTALFLVALVAAGETVVVQPGYPPMLGAVRGLGEPVRTVRLRFDDGYRLDVPALREALSPRTRLVMLATPQNPSGVAFTRDEVSSALSAMAEVCPEAVLLVDENYREAAYSPVESFATVSPRVLTCGSFSKAHGVPGVRIGWLTVRDPEWYEQLRRAKFTTAVSCGTLDEFLALELLRRVDDVLAAKGARVAAGLAVVSRWVERHADRVSWIRPDAGAFCCVRLDSGAGEFYERLSARGVAVAPGAWFGDDPALFRLGFGHEPIERLREALALMSNALTS